MRNLDIVDTREKLRIYTETGLIRIRQGRCSASGGGEGVGGPRIGSCRPGIRRGRRAARLLGARPAGKDSLNAAILATTLSSDSIVRDARHPVNPSA